VYQKDYILRMLEMLADLIAGILGLIGKGRFEEAERAVENAYYDFLKQDASFFRNIPKAKLTSVLLQKHDYTHGHLEVLSELFFAEAEVKYHLGRQKASLGYYEKSLILLEFVLEKSKLFSIEKQQRLAFLKNRINELATALL